MANISTSFWNGTGLGRSASLAGIVSGAQQYALASAASKQRIDAVSAGLSPSDVKKWRELPLRKELQNEIDDWLEDIT